MSTLLHRVGDGAARHPWRTLGAWLLAAALLGGLAGTVGGSLTDDYDIPGTDSTRATSLLRDKFPDHAGATARVVLHSRSGPVDEAAAAQVAARLAAVKHVGAVEPALRSADGRTAVLNVRFDVPVTGVDAAATAEAFEQAAAPAVESGLQAEYGGEVLDQVYEQGAAELVGFLLAGVVLLAAFGSLLAAGLPLAVAGVGLAVGMALVTLTARFTDVSTIAPMIASMVGIGVGIDYALFVVSRHRQQLLAGTPVVESVARANATAGRSVVFAGSTVLLSICGLALSGVPNFVMMGVATGICVAVCMTAAVTLLPALLGLAGTRVLSRRARRAMAHGASAKRTSHKTPLAGRWGAHAAAHPWPYAVASLLLLAILAAPVLAMRLGQSDAGSEPTSSTARRAYDLVSEGLGPGSNGPLLLAVDLTRADAPDPDALRDTVAAAPGVVAVSPVLRNPAGDTAILTVTPSTGPQDDATDALVSRLRASVGSDAVAVGGSTAAFMDFNQRLQDRLPLVIGAVVGAAFLLLVLVFRSVVAPLKAALMNLLSVGAAFGAIVALFQWGWGQSFLGLDGPVPVNAFVPVFMFAILFGLSMDYEVFLLSRVREEFARTGDSARSVVEGLSSTGRVISSAAAIMIAVFVAFAATPTLSIKMMGVGMAVAILVDATLVRLVLVPATMVLLGSRNWWLPTWLDRVLPPSDVHEGGVLLPGQRRPADEDRAALV
ncbi:MMPL family transporter [Motilibacter aurantiacus]|uniref:MMPL family transporter n=1 Tax=Motilibacter aurantiacus TaxID=2714955 RepID=UPI001409A884|nr:MMPL family transporter [Motilibacter aurantiacus]NHC44446.1 MMPL family transporter [Motilibacter aurantiacus]